MDTTRFERLLHARDLMVTQFPPHTRNMGFLVTTLLSLTLLYFMHLLAYLHRWKVFTKNLILLDDIRCISIPTNQRCDAYRMEDPT